MAPQTKRDHERNAHANILHPYKTLAYALRPIYTMLQRCLLDAEAVRPDPFAPAPLVSAFGAMLQPSDQILAKAVCTEESS